MHPLANIQGINTPLLWFKRKRDPILSETAAAALNVTALSVTPVSVDYSPVQEAAPAALTVTALSLTPIVVNLSTETDAGTASLAVTALSLTPIVVNLSTETDAGTSAFTVTDLTKTLVAVELPPLDADSAPVGIAITSLTKTPV